MVERAHRRIKDALRAHQAADNWPDVLPWIVFGLRAAPRGDDDICLQFFLALFSRAQRLLLLSFVVLQQLYRFVLVLLLSLLTFLLASVMSSCGLRGSVLHCSRCTPGPTEW